MHRFVSYFHSPSFHLSRLLNFKTAFLNMFVFFFLPFIITILIIVDFFPCLPPAPATGETDTGTGRGMR